MIWTIAYNGTEQTLAAWGLTRPELRLVSQGQDELTFTADGAAADGPPLFPNHATITLWRNRTENSAGAFSGGQVWFVGLITQVPRAGSPAAESMAYKACGPWWYLDHYVFQQAYENIFLGYAVAGDPGTALYGPSSSSHLFLNQGATANALTKINTGQQIIEALNWALKPFVTLGTPPPFQIGTVSPIVDVPIDEVRDITCAEVIHKMLRWTPDAVTWFDYSTTPPTFNCKRRSEIAPVNLDISQGALVKDLKINARYDLLAPSVQIYYETSNTINGATTLSLVKDFYPNPLPTPAISQFAALQFTVDLQGIQASSSQATLTVDPIHDTDPAWWLARHAQYKPYDPANPADVGNNIASFSIDPATVVRTANPPLDINGHVVPDKFYANELTTGQIAPWMTTVSAQRILIACKAVIVHRNGTTPQEIPLTYQCVATNSEGGTYNNQSVAQYPEPIPQGLAEQIYQAVGVLQFEGSLTLQEEDCSGALGIGSVFNLTGGSLAEWTTMNALVQSVAQNLETGETEVSFGPPKYLSAGELVDLLRVNRLRVIQYSYGTRAAGVSGDGGASALGQNTPEKNSVSGTAPANPVVMSASIDGSGAVITHASMATDCTTTWANVPPPGASGSPLSNTITIRMTDANGYSLKIQPLTVCLNGVQGTIYFLCSDFIGPSDAG